MALWPAAYERPHATGRWPHQPAKAKLKEPLANGEPSIHGPKAAVGRFYNSLMSGVPGSFSNFLGRASARIAGAYGQSGILDSVLGLHRLLGMGAR